MNLSIPDATLIDRIPEPGLADPIEALAQINQAAAPGVLVWVGLAVLFGLIFLLVRTFGRGQIEQEPPPKQLKTEKEVEYDEDGNRKLSLKEIKAARAEKLTDDLSKQARLEARQQRKGKSRAAPDSLDDSQSDDDKEDKTPDVEEDSAPSSDAAEQPADAEEPVADSGADQAVVAKSLKEGLEKTRSAGFVGRLKSLFSKKTVLDGDLLSELEEVLFTADIGVKTSQYLLETLEAKLSDAEPDSQSAWELLKEETARILLANQKPFEVGEERPQVVLVIGVNGVGKTTTIGKLADRYTEKGLKVLLVAGDTFRAAAVDQLKVWGDRTGCEVVAGADQADPSAVVFDALEKAENEGIDLVLVDTAGRLHTKVNLVEELKKVRRVCDKAIPGAPHQTLLVLDANTGQNAISQADMFSKEIGLSGLILTKLDGTAKGGVVIGISDELQVPIQFIGIGEQVEDLREFNAPDFVEALF